MIVLRRRNTEKYIHLCYVSLLSFYDERYKIELRNIAHKHKNISLFAQNYKMKIWKSVD